MTDKPRPPFWLGLSSQNFDQSSTQVSDFDGLIGYKVYENSRYEGNTARDAVEKITRRFEPG
jgi:hypothetical protein